MSESEETCPLDWVTNKAGEQTLSEEFRGVLIKRTPHIFSYGEPYPESQYYPRGQYKTIVIANVDHGRGIDYLQFAFPAEYRIHFEGAMKLMEGRSWNLSFNSDRNAGALLPDHAHIKLEDRLPGEAASGRGTRGLIDDLNRAMYELNYFRKTYGPYLPYQ